MKLKYIAKLITMIILVTSIIMACTGITNATIDPNNFKPSDLTTTDTAKAFHSAGQITKAIIYIGMVISIIMFMILGIKYMIGSVEEKAEYKKTLIPMLIGTFMIFSIGTIVSTIWSIMEKVNNV